MSEPEADKNNPPERFNELSNFAVRAAELILLTAAFGYVASEANSPIAVYVAGVITTLLFFATTMHIGFGFASRAGDVVARYIQGSTGPKVALVVGILVVMATAMVAGVAVIAVADALASLQGI